MHKITLGLVLWGLFCAWANAAQTRPSVTDSLRQVVAVGKRDTNTVNAAKSLAFRLKYEDVDAAIAYGKQSLALAQELDFKRGIASAFLTLGQCYLATGEFDKSLELFRLGGIEGHKAGIKKSVFLAYMNSGVAYDLKGDYLLASKAQLLARNLALETGNQADVRDCDYNLGITYFKIGNHSTALDFFTKAADGYKAAGMLSAYAGALDAIGNVYLKKKDYDAAERYYREAIDIAAPLESGSDLDPKYLNLGSVYFFRKDYAKAIEYTEKALKLANESGQIVVIADCYNNLGNCYRMTGNLALAEVNSLQALEISKALARNETVMEALGNLVELNVQMGKADKALTYYRELESLKDSLHVDQAAAEVANLRIQFEAEQNAQAMLLLEEQKAAAVARAEKSSLWVWAAFSTAIAMFLALIIVASYQRNRKRQAVLELAQRNADFAHKKLELEQRALRAQMNPHFIFNSLNAIQRLYIEGDLDRAGDYMSDFAQLLRKILDHSSSATISLAAELETLALYLRLEEARLGGILEHEIVTDDDIDLYNTQLPPLVLQPFVENAIWHGILPARVQGKLQIALSPGEDQQGKPHLHCTIIDNGIGIDNARKAKANSLGHESKGIKITQERLGPGGEVHAEQLPQGGTKVTLIIPVNYE